MGKGSCRFSKAILREQNGTDLYLVVIGYAKVTDNLERTMDYPLVGDRSRRGSERRHKASAPGLVEESSHQRETTAYFRLVQQPVCSLE